MDNKKISDNKQVKIDQVLKLTDQLKNTKSTALLQYQGLEANDINELRAHVKNNGGRINVIKNTLIQIALKNIGIELPEKLVGPTAIVFCDTDEVAPLKEIAKVNKEKEKTEFKYGIYKQKLLSFDELKQLISLPSFTQLMGNFIAALNNPLYRFAYALKFNQTKMALVLKAIAEKKQQDSPQA